MNIFLLCVGIFVFLDVYKTQWGKVSNTGIHLLDPMAQAKQNLIQGDLRMK